MTRRYKLPPVEDYGVIYYQGKEWILTMTLENSGYYNHQVGSIIRVLDELAGCDIFYELKRRARDDDGKLLPVYEVDHVIPEHVFADLPTIDAKKKRPAEPSQ